MAEVSEGSYVRPYRRGRVQAFAIADAQDYVPGYVVTLPATGLVEDGATATATNIVGVVNEPVDWPNGMPNLTQKVLPIGGPHALIWIADEESEFVGHLVDALVIAQAQLGTGAGLVLDATFNIFRLDPASVTPAVVITELLDPIGEVNGRVAFRFLNAARVPYGSVEAV